MGADGIECDIRVTQDGKLVIHHDPVIFANKRYYWIHRMAYAKLVELAGKEDYVPLLVDVATIIPNDKLFFIEIKSYRDWNRLQEPLLDLTKDRQNFHIMSFFACIQKKLAETPIQNGLNYIFPFRNQIKRSIKYNTELVSPLYWFLRRKTIEKYHEYDLKVIPWTINKTRFLEKFFSYGSDAIYTNNLPEALKLREKMN